MPFFFSEPLLTLTPMPAPQPAFSSLFGAYDPFDVLDEFQYHPRSYYHSSPCHQRYQRPQPRRQHFPSPLAHAIPFHIISVPRPAPRPQPRPVSAKFAMRETEDAYELVGQVPGVDRETLNVEFPDPQTMVVSGRGLKPGEKKPAVETPAAETTTAAAAETTVEEPAPTSAPEAPEGNQNNTTEGDNKDKEETSSTTSSRRNSFRATVEDAVDEDEAMSVVSWSSVRTPSGSDAEDEDDEVEKPAAKKAKVEKKAAEKKEKGKEKEKAAPAPAPAPAAESEVEEYLAEFKRAWTFDKRVNVEGVEAGLENGVLKVRVPKAPLFVTKRISLL